MSVTMKRSQGLRTSAAEMAKYSISNYGLVVFTVLLVLGFGFAKSSTFFTVFTLRSILSTVAITILFALAETVVIAAQQFDLSVGYMGGLAAVVMVMLLVRTSIPWVLVVVIGIAIGVAGGVANGLLVTVLKIDSFIVTLGSGTFAYGLAELVTGGVQVVGNLPSAFTGISGSIWNIPVSALIALAVAICAWLVLEFTVFGRRLYVVGANMRGAELVGLRPSRLVRRAFIVAGVFVGIGAVLMASQFQVAEADIGPQYLLPGFAAAFLGATSVRPGRVNVWGTVVAAVLLSIAETGLLELGAAFYVSSLFSGGLLVVAVGVTVTMARRKARPTVSGDQRGTLPGKGAAQSSEAEGGAVSSLAAAVLSRRSAVAPGSWREEVTQSVTGGTERPDEEL